MFSVLPTSRARRKIYLSVWDFVWALICPVLALYVRDGAVFFERTELHAAIFQYWVMSGGFTLLALFAFRLHDGMTRNFSIHNVIDIAEAVLFAQLLTCAVLFAWSRLDGIPRSAPLIHGLLLAAGLIAARIVMRIIAGGTEATPGYQDRHERVIVIGANRLGAAFIQLLRAYAPQSTPVIAVLDDDPNLIGRAPAGVEVLGAPHELDAIISEFAIHGIKANRIVIAGEVNFLSAPTLEKIERVCRHHDLTLSYLPQMMGLTERRVTEVASSAPAQAFAHRRLPAYFAFKRLIDVLASLVLIIVLSPVMLIAAVMVRLDVGSPVIFWQERMGWRQRSFLIYKFRSLRAPFDYDGNPSQDARRPSRVGRFLRATRIDELPQLFNVLFGDMSLIGPRPLLPEDQPSNPSLRLAVRPGITGWAQINGAKLVTKEEKEKLDAWYIENASFRVDLTIAFYTLFVLMRSHMESPETAADADQVHNKDLAFRRAIAERR